MDNIKHFSDKAYRITIYIYIYIYIYTIKKLDKTRTLCKYSVNPTCTDRFPTFDLSFECCQSCSVFFLVVWNSRF